MYDLSIIIVNWNTKELLRRCLNSIYHNTNKLSFEVLVVDNASRDGSAEMIKKEFPQVRLVRIKRISALPEETIRVFRGQRESMF